MFHQTPNITMTTLSPKQIVINYIDLMQTPLSDDLEEMDWIHFRYQDIVDQVCKIALRTDVIPKVFEQHEHH